MPDPSPFDENDSSGGLVAKQSAGDNAAPLSITEISAILKRTVEDRFGFVRLRGELSGVKRAASGHLYCSLKDEKAVIDAVMWRGSTQRLTFKPEDGLEVIASGKLTTYPGRSKYQIVVERMEIAGEGALLALLEKTRARLAAEGLFAPERKRALPFLPRTIGVVTSPTGAVIRDILHRLSDRFPSHVLVWPVLVQGAGAAEQIAHAVRGFSAIQPGGPIARPDLVIVARGGGSIEDLWSFNEESVVRAIAESTIPIISAVGHETDTTLADHAADLRAPTPTAAAEIAVPVRAELLNQLDELAHRKRRCARRPITLGRERLQARVKQMPRPDAVLARHAQNLDDLSERLRRGLKDRHSAGREKFVHSMSRFSAPDMLARSKDLKTRADRLVMALRQSVRSEKARLEGVALTSDLLFRRQARARDEFTALGRVLPQLNPEMPLQRGFARVTDADGQTITARAVAAKEAALVLIFKDGDLSVAVGPSTKGRPRKKDDSLPQGDLFQQP